MRSGLEILKMWDNLDIDYKNKHLIFYCGTGWRAAEVMYYAELMGLNRISLYDGGWFEWSAKFGKIDQEVEAEEAAEFEKTTSSVMTSVILNTITVENQTTSSSGQQTTKTSVTTNSFNSSSMNSTFNVLLCAMVLCLSILLQTFL